MNRNVKNYIILSLSVIIVCYSLFRLYPIVLGPSIKIISPAQNSPVATTTFEVIGVVRRAKEVGQLAVFRKKIDQASKVLKNHLHSLGR
jgi:hypothetical protein